MQTTWLKGLANKPTIVTVDNEIGKLYAIPSSICVSLSVEIASNTHQVNYALRFLH